MSLSPLSNGSKLSLPLLATLLLFFSFAGCQSSPAPNPDLGEMGAVLPTDEEIAAFPKSLHPAAFRETQAAPLKFQTLPTSTLVEPFLTPMAQGTPEHLGSPGSCIAWSVGYALGSFTANQTLQGGVDSNDHLASPAFLYAKMLNQEGLSCPVGTKDTDYLNYLVQFGSPSLASVAYQPDCTYLGDIDLDTPPDPEFKIGSWQFVSPADRDLVKAHLAEGLPLAFAGMVYQGFGAPLLDFDGVYHGSNAFEINQKTGQPAGHGMFLIGYDDNKGDPKLGQGAYLIMNSFGTDWGENGFLWISYDAFEKAEKSAFVAQPLIPFQASNGTLLTPSPDQAGIPQALIMDAFQWVYNTDTGENVYLIFTYQFDAPLQVINFALQSPGGVTASHPINAWQNNSYTFFTRMDHQQFLSGTYLVTMDGITQDGTQVSYTGSVDVGPPGSGGDGLPPADFLAGILGGNGQPANIE